MPEQSGGEKTLPASPRKIEKAREKGNVARSQDLSAAATLTVALLGLYLFGPIASEALLTMTAYYFAESYALNPNVGNMQTLLIQALQFALPMAVPMMILLMAVGVAINITQIGFIVAPQALQPKFERINPVSGFRRFASIRSLVELAKSLAKLGIVGWVAWITLEGQLPEMLGTMHQTPGEGALAMWDMVMLIWFRIVLVMIVIGLLDFAFQRYQYGRDLMMTVQEARDEAKDLDGDPRIKQRVRQIQRQMAMQRMMQDVPEAEVVVTNPTTYAVALRYNAAEMEAPIVIAKGERLIAQRIRDLASEHEVPIVQRPELARAMYQTVEIGQAVPESLFRAVAEILAFVYEIDRRESKLAEREQTPVMTRAA